MNPSIELFRRLKEKKLIALLAPVRASDCVTAFEALDPLGVALEVVLRTPAALEGIRAVRARHPAALVLAGTVMTRAQAEEAVAAGAAGVVSADYLPAVVEVCVRHDVMCIPGGMSDAGKQLAQKAELYGVDFLALRETHPYQWVYKLFPASAGVPVIQGVARALQSVYKGLTIVYTGGVTRANLEDVVRGDPDGIFCGSALTAAIANPGAMRREAEDWLAVIHGAAGGGAKGQKAAAPGAAGETASGGGAAPAASAGGVSPAPRAAAAEVVAFGELMLRLSPHEGLRFRQARVFDAHFGGAEANVAVALAQFGRRSRFVTALPAHAIGQSGVDELRARGVDTSFIVRCGDRVGLYYLEHGASQRPSRVIYDRAGSAVSLAGTGVFDWAGAFEGARWFHWSGITPALGERAAAALREALEAARRAGLKVSVDLNYRSRLWSRDEARRVMTPLMEHVDVAIGNEQDAADVFGIAAGSSEAEKGKLDVAGYESAARELVARFGLEMAAVTLRESVSASDNRWSACLFDGKEFMQSRNYAIHVVDRVGGGDAFSAGLIHGLLEGRGSRGALEFGAAAACLKQTIRGDFNLVTAEEVDALAGGDAAGRIKR